MSDTKNQGLEGVVAATTRLSSVDGEAGELLIAGFPVEELAPRASFEETTWLLWNGSLPSADELEAFRHRLAGRRTLPAATLELLRAAAKRRVPAMDALRMAAGTLSLIEAGETRGRTPSRWWLLSPRSWPLTGACCEGRSRWRLGKILGTPPTSSIS